MTVLIGSRRGASLAYLASSIMSFTLTAPMANAWGKNDVSGDCNASVRCKCCDCKAANTDCKLQMWNIQINGSRCVSTDKIHAPWHPVLCFKWDMLDDWSPSWQTWWVPALKQLSMLLIFEFKKYRVNKRFPGCNWWSWCTGLQGLINTDGKVVVISISKVSKTTDHHHWVWCIKQKNIYICRWHDSHKCTVLPFESIFVQLAIYCSKIHL